jgi:hypothetical protein
MRFAQAAEQGEKWADIRDARQSDGLVENAYWGNRIALVFQWLEYRADSIGLLPIRQTHGLEHLGRKIGSNANASACESSHLKVPHVADGRLFAHPAYKKFPRDQFQQFF